MTATRNLEIDAYEHAIAIVEREFEDAWADGNDDLSIRRNIVSDLRARISIARDRNKARKLHADAETVIGAK